ncbi:YhfT family protein [Vibrio anguillarum]|uniref:YhfT family protein n=1 Tax=Vibrio anguillarum TaxID=55601 RepID=UPI000426E8CF|nr:YhfT family protein [Vibrio anguillarum]
MAYFNSGLNLLKNLPFLAVTGALIAAVSNGGIFAGSEVSIFSLAEAYKITDPAAHDTAMKQVALSELFSWPSAFFR